MDKILEDMKKCYGCQACKEICSANAIFLFENGEGFLYPEIDSNKCIDCGICRDICSVINTPDLVGKLKKPVYYAYMAPNNIRLESSSGGIFSELANYVIDNNGLICGAIFSKDFRSVRHAIAAEKDQLHDMRKSKYIQSDIGDVFFQIQDSLLEDKKVLFTGCPCQVSALKLFLNKPYKNLYTMDFLCHGVASSKVWISFLEELANGKGVDYVDFRDKSKGWGGTLSIKLDNGENYIFTSSLWYKGFLNDLFSRESCSTCQFSGRHVSDVTIGDFWGIDNIKKGFNDNLGTSFVQINTLAGNELFVNSTLNKACKFIEISAEAAEISQPPCYRNYKAHPGRSEFFSTINSKNKYSLALKSGLDRKYDFGILGLWYSNNYGAILTSYSLYALMESLGYKVILIDVPDGIMNEFTDTRNELSLGRQFIYKYCSVSKRYSFKEEKELNKLCNGFICGSDSLWGNFDYQHDRGFYFLSFSTADKKKIAYGTSFGDQKWISLGDNNSEVIKMASFLLQRFDAVSIREEDGVNLCKKYLKVDSEWVLDPVFLCDKNNLNSLINTVNISRSLPEVGAYIFAYILQPTQEKEKILKYIEKEKRMPIICVSDMNKEIKERYSVESWNIKEEANVSVEEWLYLISNAALVVTDSYHGFCYSIIFNREFMCLEPRDGLARFMSLSKILVIDEFVNLDFERTVKLLSENNSIDYNKVNPKLDIEKRKSIKWLKQSLEKPHLEKCENLSYDMCRIMIDMNNKVQNQEIRIYDKKVANLERLNSNLIVKIFLTEHLHNKKVAIRGAGEHTARLLDLLAGSIDFQCIITKDNGFNYTWPCPLIQLNDIVLYDIDTILISSYKFREDMKNDMAVYKDRYEILDIYDYLGEIGILMKEEFYYAHPFYDTSYLR